MPSPYLNADDPTKYAGDLDGFRAEKDRFFFSSPQSPIAPADRQLGGLRYFPPDLSYRVLAAIERLDNDAPQSILMTTSAGSEREFVELARLRFELKGQPCELTGYGEVGDDEVFLPFRDATSGHSTYGAGRYLEVACGNKTEAIIDFNLAYNPFCAYSSRFVCPVPPPGNRLTVAIEAGEKTFPRHDHD